ncbi:MAG TPA: nucleotide exchange factor GrpE [Chloroflexia bacterium]|nr:nucleotide exchange factor GrpE [Chloroflexia bacterium]
MGDVDNKPDLDMEEEVEVEENSNDGVEADSQDDAPVEQKRDLAAEYLDALQRERASFINYRRRVEQERADTFQYATSALIKKLLPVLDDFDRALSAIPEKERQGNKWVEGVELIDKKLHSIMEQEGVEPIEALGQPFDPNIHEAVAFDDNSAGGSGVEDQGSVDTVSEVFANGYKLHDRVIRPAIVKVTRG